jgi:hypothetical protein
MKIEVEFPCDFDSKEVGVIQLGRMYLGSKAVRLFFDKDGRMKMLIPLSAVNEGSVILWEDGTPPPAISLFGMAKLKQDGG